MNERHVTKSRWSRLSPLLDELLDLPAPERAARLDALRAGPDADLADDLAELLRRQDAMEEAGYLAEPAALEPPAEQLAAGQTIGSAYTLEREIGRGGMGTVWLAERTDGRFEGRVAIKFLSAGLLGRGDTGNGGRFAREGQILARLAHPNIARLIDAGVSGEGERPYLVLEYVDGEPITRYCEAQAPGIAERITLFLDVLSAVAHAHNRLILHRDLKPSNILVTAGGEVKLLDFGIAKLLSDADAAQGGAAATELTRQAGRVFTPQYATPEQLEGGDVTTATDVYALGVLLYQLLSGQHPTPEAVTGGTGTLAQMQAVLKTEPRRVSETVRRAGGDARRSRELQGDLDTIVAKALKKAPAERYANAAALAEDLRRWLAHEPVAARPDSALYALGKFVRRHRVAVAAGSLAALTLAALTTLSLVQARRAERAEQLAQARRAASDELLGYLLGDFADKLRPIGRLELLDSVGGKALEHLAQDDGMITPEGRLQRAKALTVLGEVRVSKRELDKAIEPLQAARKLLEGPPPDGADSGAWRKAQGTAAFWLGHAYFTQRRFAPAQQAWQDYLDSSEAWLAQAPGQFDPISELSYARTNLGTLQINSGELSEAARHFEASIDLKRQALRLKPDQVSLKMELGNSMSWLGNALIWQGDFEPARAVFAEGVRVIVEARQNNRQDWEWLNRESVMRTWLAEALLGLGLRAEARAELDVAAQLMHEILQREPGNAAWAFQLVKVERMQATQDDTRRTRLPRLQALASRMEALHKVSPLARPGRLPAHALIVEALAEDLAAQGQAAQAREVLTRMLAQLEEVFAKRPEDARLQLSLARTRLALAEVADGNSARETMCRLAALGLAEVPSLRRVHFEITQAWADAQTCLGQSGEAAAEIAWLAMKKKAAARP